MNTIQDKLKLKFDDSFFDEEIRCDYKVTQKTKKIWAVELDLIAELLRVCNKFDIKVTAFAGTVLGAVRHKGFIPWDDDIDVCMDRENYKKLLSVANEFKSPYFFQTGYDDKEFFMGYARLRNSLTTGVVEWEKSPNYNSGIYLDIYVLDGYVEDDNLLKKQLADRFKIERKIRLYHWNHSKGIKRIVKMVLKPIVLIGRTYESLLQEYDQCITRYNDGTQRITLMTHIPSFLKKYWCYKSDLEEVIVVPFENIEIPISKNYDVLLNNAYGNYMEFPPIESRGKWHEDAIYFDPDLPYEEYYKKLNENQ